MIARWTGRIKPGKVTGHVSGFQDVLPTCMDLAGAETPEGLDGISFASTLFGKGAQREHEVLYFELGNQQALLQGGFKLIRRWNKKGEAKIELYHLEKDPAETSEVGAMHADRRDRMIETMNRSRVPSKVFPAVYDDAGK